MAILATPDTVSDTGLSISLSRLTGRLRLDQVKLRCHVDRFVDRAVNGAGVRVHIMGAFGGLALICGRCQVVSNVNTLDDEHVAFLLDLADRVRSVRLRICRDSARLKGAA